MTNHTTNETIERRTYWLINNKTAVRTNKPISEYRAGLHAKQARRGVAVQGSVTEIDHSTYIWSARRV